MNIKFKDDILPHLIAIIAFVVVTVIFYQPLIFSNNEIYQNDVQQGFGASQEIIDFRNETGEEALWTNSMFGGMPAYLLNTQWSGDILKYVYKIWTFGFPSGARHTFIAITCFYILLLCFRVNPYVAIAGGIAYGFNTFNIISIEAGHIWKVTALAFSPLVIGGVHLIFRKKHVMGFMLTALGLSMQIRSNHLQITYYLFLLILLYGLFLLWEAIRNKEYQSLIKSVGIAVLAVLLALGANLGRLWSSLEYGQYSTRGPSELEVKQGDVKNGLDRDYVFNWSSGKMESFTLLIPNFQGGASVEKFDLDSYIAKELRKNNVPVNQVKPFIQRVPTYHGVQPSVAGPMYAGAIVCFLFVVGLFYVEKRIRYWLIAGTVLGIVLSWGKNFETFNYLFYSYFPGYNKFRSVSMAVSIAFFTIPLLAFIGLDRFFKQEKPYAKKVVYTALGFLGFLVLVTVIGSNMTLKGPVDQQLGGNELLLEVIRGQRSVMFQNDGIRTILFSLALLVLFYFYSKEKLSKNILVGLIIILTSLDIVLVSKRYLNSDNFVRNAEKQFAPKTEADERILADKGAYRVLNLQNPFNEARTSYYHKSIGGYHGAKLKRYQQLIENHISGEMAQVYELLRAGNADFSDMKVLNMLNTKYFKAGDAGNLVFQNRNNLGNAWFATEVITATSPQDEIDKMHGLITGREAVVDNSKFQVSGSLAGNVGSITLEEYKPNYLKYSSTSNTAGLGVFSEIYYKKGWKAYIDEVETEIIRSNFVLRSLEIPQGTHTIEFKFEPNSYFVGNKVMLVSNLLIILTLIGAIFLEVRTSNTNGSEG